MVAFGRLHVIGPILCLCKGNSLLKACKSQIFSTKGGRTCLPPHERVLISTGLAIAIPDGFAGFVQPRSGMALKRGLSIANTPGLIDAHYRGELKVIAINLDAHESIHIERGERIAQLVIQEVPVVQLFEVDELDETDRGTGGFGSSGAH